MKRLKKVIVQIVNGFIDNDQGGNPAGLVLNADDLSDYEKQIIAAKTNLSETAFVSASAIADFKFDFYTPTKQIAHCGHATIATFSYLKQNGLLKNSVSSKETIDGVRKILLNGENAFMEQTGPVYVSIKEDMNNILLSLGLQTHHLLNKSDPWVVSTGNSFLIIGVKDTMMLKNLDYDPMHIVSISKKYDLIGYYVFALNAVMPGRDATARMFAPYYGIAEESATGMAAGPLACYLYDKLSIRKSHFLIEQGFFMKKPSPSLIITDLTIHEDKIVDLMVGGKGSSVKKIEIEIE